MSKASNVSMFDYHVHTHFSADCAMPMHDACMAAIDAGISEIAFTDHVEHEPADMSFGFYRYDAYRHELAAVQERFGDQLTVLAGAEVDFNTRIADQVEAFLAQHSFDFVIGSVHYGDGGEIIFPEYFSERSLDDVLLPYFEEVHAAVETGWFDSIGHLDLPKRYAPQVRTLYDPARYRDSLDAVFQSMTGRQVSFEVNTSGLRQPPRATMPGPRIVQWYVDAGGDLLTVGSDSHVPETIGAGLEQALDMLELCGVTSVSSFRGRVRHQTSLSVLRARSAP